MSRKLKVWLTAAAVLALVAVGIWWLGTVLGLKGRDVWILRGGLWLLATFSALLIAWFVARRGPAAPKADAQGTREVDAAMAAARSRLKASRLSGTRALQRLPTVLLLGAEGSGKSSSVVRSQLETELLTGDVFRGELIAPTRIVNLWYTREGLIMEAGGRLLSDPPRWLRVLQHLQPRRARSAFWGAAQPARAVMVCVSCEDLLKGGTDAVSAAARTLRSRLGDLTTALGARLPVYVVFTKADTLPHFTDYVRNFSRDEVRDAFGTTFPLEQMPPDSSPEHVFQLVDRSFQRLFQSLAAKRLKFLPRESAPEVAGSAYEFPREFRKIAPAATSFLVELSRPNQLEISPFLRGFYFIGVRPIVVTENAIEAAVPVAVGGRGGNVPVGATTVFDPAKLEAIGAAAGPRMTAMAATSRRVPQWVFLDRLFPDVVLGDRAALGSSQSSRRVGNLRRLAAIAVIVAALVGVAGLAISYANNRQLQADTLAVRRGLAQVPASGNALPSVASLQRLDAGQRRLQQLADYERNGAPWRLRWGLYTGSAMYPSLRTSYFAALERAMFSATRDSLAMALRRLPDTPGQSADYGQTYNTLKAYLIVTTYPDRATPGFLAPVLMERWQGSSRLDPTRAELARRQFAFYADALPGGNPYRAPVDDEAVAGGRAFLRKFAAAEAVYRTMLGEAAGKIPPVQFERQFPSAAGIVRDPYVVSGAFTKAGWDAMQASLAHADRFLSGEDWVTGVRTTAATDRAAVLGQLKSMYVRDYIEQWRTFLKAASVTQFADVGTASRVLGSLSSNQSPLLALLALVSRHTAVDTTAIAPAFQPVHVVTPSGDSTKYIGGGNEAYVNALVSLQGSLEQVARGTGDAATAAAGQALNDANQAELAAKQLANKFRVDQEAGLHLVVQRLLETPILNTQTSLQAVGPARLNAQGRTFCAPFQRLMAKFPFNPTGAVDAGVDEVSALFQPGSGALWSFVDGQLGGSVVRQGSLFAENPGSQTRVSPGFIAFLNRAAAFSTALYHSDGSGPALALTLRPILSDEVPALAINVDGQIARFTRSSLAAKRVAWLGAESQIATLSGEVGGREREILGFQGTWALFRLFGAADWQGDAGSYTVKWRLPGVAADGTPLTATFEVTAPGIKPVLRRDFFQGVSCTGRITQ
ncbi:MAG: ImcF-related family protein [Gemmatimonadales bacterium]